MLVVTNKIRTLNLEHVSRGISVPTTYFCYQICTEPSNFWWQKMILVAQKKQKGARVGSYEITNDGEVKCQNTLCCLDQYSGVVCYFRGETDHNEILTFKLNMTLKVKKVHPHPRPHHHHPTTNTTPPTPFPPPFPTPQYSLQVPTPPPPPRK